MPVEAGDFSMPDASKGSDSQKWNHLRPRGGEELLEFLRRENLDLTIVIIFDVDSRHWVDIGRKIFFSLSEVEKCANQPSMIKPSAAADARQGVQEFLDFLRLYIRNLALESVTKPTEP